MITIEDLYHTITDNFITNHSDIKNPNDIVYSILLPTSEYPTTKILHTNSIIDRGNHYNPMVFDAYTMPWNAWAKGVPEYHSLSNKNPVILDQGIFKPNTYICYPMKYMERFNEYGVFCVEIYKDTMIFYDDLSMLKIYTNIIAYFLEKTKQEYK